MQRELHDEFWRLFDRTARPAIERSCRSASARLSERTMDPDDMIAWVHERVWKLLEREAAPTFHDDPTPEQAVERLVEHAGTLARWAYLALSRRHWRREQRQSEYMRSMSRAERLSMVSTVGDGFESREALSDELDKLKDALGPDLSAKLAASWPERAERERVAMALGATREQDDELIEQASDGTMKENTVQQMRSRARRRAAEIVSQIVRNTSALAVISAVLALGMATASARANEQTGGGRGGKGMVAPTSLVAYEGEQTGGGRGGLIALDLAARSGGGEQGGGRP